MNRIMELQKRDLEHIWHPCSQMKDYETFRPIVIERGKGAYIYDVDGRSYLDAVSSWWVNLFGHSNERLNEALKRQVDRLEHVIFANFSHEPAIELAERIAGLAPDGLEKVVFSDNGSSAVEIALKLSFQYHQQIGKAKKTKFVCLTDAYHGETIGALSVGDLDLYSKVFSPIMMDTIRAEGPDCYRCRHGLARETCSAECFEHMESILGSRHEEISAVIIEPLVQCAAGMKMYAPDYLRKLRDACDRYEVHLIADEIAVGFGRTGRMFAVEHAGVAPDLMCLSKGLTGGYMPLALTLATNRIYEAFYGEYDELKAFMHSHSYTGNPLSSAVACEVLNIFRDECVLESNMEKSERIARRIAERVSSCKYVGDFRHIGMIFAIELVEDRESKKGFDWKKRVGYEIYRIALGKGLLIRPLGNVIYFMPPYVTGDSDIDFLIDKTFESINEYFSS